MSADDYAAFIGRLCGPPGPERDRCMRCLTRRLLGLYAEHGGAPPAGLLEFARSMGIGGEGAG